MVRVGGGCVRQSRHGRGFADSRDCRAGFRADDQPRRRPPSDSRQCHSVDEPRVEGAGHILRYCSDLARLGFLPVAHVPRASIDRCPDGSEAGERTAGGWRVRVGPERGGHRQRDLRRDRREVPRASVPCRSHPRRPSRSGTRRRGGPWDAEFCVAVRERADGEAAKGLVAAAAGWRLRRPGGARRRKPAHPRRDRADPEARPRGLFRRDDRSRSGARETRRLHRLPYEGRGSRARGRAARSTRPSELSTQRT